jgi:hypothetical protein
MQDLAKLNTLYTLYSLRTLYALNTLYQAGPNYEHLKVSNTLKFHVSHIRRYLWDARGGCVCVCCVLVLLNSCIEDKNVFPT